MLVQALEEWVETLEIQHFATLDYETLFQYSGKGRCRKILLVSGFESGHLFLKPKFEKYAKEKGWHTHLKVPTQRPKEKKNSNVEYFLPVNEFNRNVNKVLNKAWNSLDKSLERPSKIVRYVLGLEYEYILSSP